MSSTLTIGRVAEAAGISVETIRFYQRSGLIDEPARPPGGVRRFGVEFVARLRFIKRAVMCAGVSDHRDVNRGR